MVTEAVAVAAVLDKFVVVAIASNGVGPFNVASVDVVQPLASVTVTV